MGEYHRTRGGGLDDLYRLVCELSGWCRVEVTMETSGLCDKHEPVAPQLPQDNLSCVTLRCGWQLDSRLTTLFSRVRSPFEAHNVEHPEPRIRWGVGKVIARSRSAQ